MHCIIITSWLYSVYKCSVVSSACYVWQVKIGRAQKHDVGYLRYEYQHPIVPVGVITISIIIVIVAVVVIVVLVCYACKKRFRHQMENADSSIVMMNCTGESITYLALERICRCIIAIYKGTLHHQHDTCVWSGSRWYSHLHPWRTFWQRRFRLFWQSSIPCYYKVNKKFTVAIVTN